MEVELYPVPLPRHNDPGAVGIVGIAMGKAWTLYGSIETLHYAATRLTCRTAKGPYLNHLAFHRITALVDRLSIDINHTGRINYFNDKSLTEKENGTHFGLKK